MPSLEAAMARRPPRSISRVLPVLGTALLLLGAVTWPLLFTYSGFSGDWEHHLWLVWHQSLSIQSGNLPSLFLNSAYSVFNPIYAFYAGTLYSIAGTLALVFGPLQVYILVFVLDFAAALGGWYWLGRMAGLGRWPAMVPGLIFITSTYYVAIVYVQGDWPEFTGLSMVALMVASGISVLRADRLRLPAALALAASSLVFFGSHVLTMLLTLTTLGLAGLAIVILIPEARGYLTRRAAMRVASIAIPAAMVNSWYLLPTAVYASRTHVGSSYTVQREALKTTTWLVSMPHLFTFSRTSGIGLPPPYYLAFALPVLAIVWTLLGLLVLPVGNPNRAWTRLLLICSGLAVLIAVVMTHAGLLVALPNPYILMQFGYRLEIYVLMMLCAAVLAALALSRTASRRVRGWTWLAIPVCAASVIGAVQQVRGYPYPGQDRYVTLQYYGEVETGNNEDYQDNSERHISGKGLARLDFPFEAVRGDRVSVPTNLRPGTLVTTNIAAGSYLVHVTGAKVVGVDAASHDMVLAIGPRSAGANGAGGPQASATGSGSQATVSVSTSDSLPIVLGRVLSLCGLAGLAVRLLFVPVRRLMLRGGVRSGRVEVA